MSLRSFVLSRRAVAIGAGFAIMLTVAGCGPDKPVAAVSSTGAVPSTVAATVVAPSAVPSVSLSAGARQTLSPAATTPTPKPESTTSAPAAATNGWIPVDQETWREQLDAYEKTRADPAPADAGNLPEFRADCEYSHRLADDPIVFPGLPGASHMHSFVGNKAVGADTRPADLMTFTATTCKPVQDHSAYWVPTLYDNGTGKPVETTGFRVYYRSLQKSSDGQLPVPNGLRMIAGDAKKKVPTPRGAQGQFYCAFYGPGDIDGVARSTDGNWPICGGDATLHFMLRFPDCWDGEHLDSPNHKDHVAFGSGDACPATHPKKIPSITFDIQYGTKGSPAGFHLSSDPAGRSASSMHGDAFVAWDLKAMNQRTRNCIVQRRTCDNDGYDPFSSG